MRRVFIAHPISGDIKSNMKKVLEICRRVHDKNTIPVAPYLVSLQYLDDTVVEDRELGMEANYEAFHAGYITELWLYGDRISESMRGEIELARELGIPIIAKTPETEKALAELRRGNWHGEEDFKA
ncbi:MAG: DUF4406 domain-containing protein [Patescibacteria group bacterium]